VLLRLLIFRSGAQDLYAPTGSYSSFCFAILSVFILYVCSSQSFRQSSISLIIFSTFNFSAVCI
jgi:hypothetical protein